MSAEINILTEMGFSKSKAEKALVVTGNKGVEAAMEWLLAHSDELDAAEPIQPILPINPPLEVDGNSNEAPNETIISPTPETNLNASVPNSEENSTDDKRLEDCSSPQQAQSIKCLDCGRMFKTETEVEYHAVKTGHQNFSESTEEVKPLTEEEKLEQRRKLEERIRERRQKRLESERQEAIEQEKTRRKTGQEIAMAKQRQEEVEMKRIADQKKKEKMEDRLARQRVLEAIEADKQARREKFGGIAPEKPEVIVAPAQSTPRPLIQQTNTEYDHCKLQIRLTDGQTLTQSFGANEELAAVRLYVQLNRTDTDSSVGGPAAPFSLMTSFPRKIFTEQDMAKPLNSLGLVPSAVLIVTKCQ